MGSYYKYRRKNVIFGFCLILFIMVLTGCSSNKTEPTTPSLEENNFNYFYSDNEHYSLSTDIYKLQDSLITRTGYTFEGVFSGENGNGIKYFDNQGNLIRGMTISANTVLFPKWTIKTYKLNLICENKIYKSMEITYGSILSLLEPPRIEGQTFKGWMDKNGILFTDELGYSLEEKKDFTNGSGYSFDEAENVVVLYAKFEINQYTVNLDFLGKGNNRAITVKHGERVLLPKVENYEDYECLGWTYQSSAGEKFYNNEPITEDITLYANWLKYKIISIKYGTEEIDTIKIYQDGKTIEVENIKLNLPIGCKIKGWYTNPSLSGSSMIRTLDYGIKGNVIYLDLKTTYFSSGIGSIENPYLISTSQHLQNIEKFPSAYFKIINDITVFKEFEPISEFFGVLNGDNHNLDFANCPYLLNFNRTEDAQFAALIKNNKGTISNIIIDGLNVKSNEYCHSGTYLISMGGVVGINHSTGNIKNIRITKGDFKCDRNNSAFGVVSGVNYGIIEKCSVSNASIYATGDCGGITGKLLGGKVSNCTFSGSIGLYITNDNGKENLRSWGGIVGWAYDTSGKGIRISDCIVNSCTFNYYGSESIYHRPGIFFHNYCNLQIRVGVICGNFQNKNNSIFENCSFEDSSSASLNLISDDFHNGSHERKFLFAYYKGMIGLYE